MSENGTITYGPQTIPGEGFAFGEDAGPLLTLNINFTITSGTTTITGTKSTVLANEQNYGACGTFPGVTDFGVTGTGTENGADAVTDYTANIQTPAGNFTDSGGTVVTLYSDVEVSNSEGGSGNADIGETFFNANPVASQGASSLTLSPATGTNTVGTSYTVTGTADDSSGNPVQGVTLQFSVSGANTASGSCVTNASGQCSFSYTSTNLGQDTISGYADNNGNGAQDAGEPSASATVTQSLPAGGQLFAANTTCGASNGLLINGSHITVGGAGEHSNGSLTVNGSSNTATFGSSGGPNNCQATVNGSGNTFGGSPKPTDDPVAEPYPVDYRAQTIPCTYSGASFTFNTANTTIPPGVYCATGTVTFNGSKDTGNITIIAQSIVLNGSGYQLTPNTNNLLFYAKGASQLTINGSNSSLSGAIFAPNAAIVLNGSGSKNISGPVEGLNDTLDGSNWSIG